MKKKNSFFVAATENYRIKSGTYDFLICKIEDSEDNRTVQIKCKFLKTALRKIMGKVDSNEEIIDYEVAVSDNKGTTYINLHGLENHEIKHYLS